jgi:hypothetical protein
VSFLNTLFLFATAAAALPILYHLVRRIRAKTVPFSSLMFLKATPKKLVRRRRLKDLLLMTVRSLLFLLLALAFARPYLPAEQIPFVEQRERESVVILIDRSFSMQHGTTFEEALDAARSRIEAGGADDEFALIAFDDGVQQLSSLDTDGAVHQGALRTLESSFRTTDFFPALQRASDVLQDAQHDRRVVVMISDFQDAGWTGALDDWHLPSGIVFETISVGAEDVPNAYVEAFQLSSQRVDGTEILRSDARIAARGEAASQSHTAALTVDDTEVDLQTVPGRDSAPLSFQYEAPRDGFYQGHLALNEDALPADDRYFFTDRVDGLPGLVAIDRPSDTGRRAAFFLENAFALGEASRFQFARTSQVDGGTLQQHEVVFLANQTTASSAEETALRRFVEEGGTLVISPGDQVDLAALNRLLVAFGVGRIETVVDARGELGYETIIGEVDMRHPIFQPFAGSGAGAILRPTFRRFARLTPSPETTVIGRFDSGDVFLAERGVGSGRVLFYASTFSTSWTDLPLDEMYVPFLYQLAEYGAQLGEEQHIFRVGEAVALSGTPSETVEVRDPDGRLFPVTLDEQGQGYFRETTVPGHYAAAGTDETRLFSVNVDPRESNLQRRDVEEMYATVVAPPDDAPTTPEEAAAAAVETEERDQKLWRILIMTVIALFALETYLAHRGTSGSPAGRTPIQVQHAARSTKHQPR